MAETRPDIPATDLLALHAMPDLAAALRERKGAIIELWIEAVERYLPSADELTTRQVRDTLPRALDVLADAFASDAPQDTEAMAIITKAHGVNRFHQSYNVKELIIEYRLLRRIMQVQVADALGGLTLEQAMALDMGLDITLQQSVVAFVDHQRQQIEAANTAEARFLAFLSHDLRNHLNHATLVLEMHVERLRDQPQFAEDADDLEKVRQSIFQTIKGMEQLLQVERLRRDTFHPRRTTVDLSSIVKSMCQGIAREAAAKGLQLANEVPAGFTVSSDPDLIALVLQNLLGNAVKFSDGGIIRVAAERPADGGWRLSVTDQGPGIAPEVAGRIFEAFARGDTRGRPGIGLGLAIASQSAQRLGGRLSVQSTLGEGSTFLLELPGEVG